MARKTQIPRYQRTAVGYNPVIETGEAAVFGSLADRLSNWGDRFADIGVAQAKTEGQAAGAAAGAQEGIPDVPSADTINIRKKAYRDAALLAHKARIQSDIRDTVNTLEAVNRLDPDGFTAALDGYKSGLMSEVHPDIAPDVELLFNDYGGRAATRINTNLADQSFKDDLLAIDNQITSLSDEALNYARDNDEQGLFTAKARLQSLQAQAVKSNLMTPAQVEQQVTALNDAVTVESAAGEFGRVLYTDGIDKAEQAYVNFRNSDIESLGMDTGQRDKIVARMRSMLSEEQARINRDAARDKAARNATEKALKAETKDMIYLLEHGKLNDASRGRLEQLQDLTQGTDLAQPLQDALNTYNAVDKFNRLSVAEQETYLDQVQSEGMSNGKMARLADHLEKVMSERRRALENGEGLDLYYSDGYAPAPDTLDFASEDALRQGLMLRNQQSEQASALYQYHVSPLREGEISMLTEYLGEAAAPEKLRLLGIMQDELGSNFLPVMRDLDKKGATGLAMAGGLINTTGPVPARLLLTGSDVIKEIPAIMPAGPEKTLMDADINDALGTAFLASPKHRGAVVEAVRGIYAGLSAQEGAITGAYDKDRMDRAVMMATGGIHRWSGSRWGAVESAITPPVIGWDEEKTTQWLEEDLNPADIDDMGGVAGFSAEEFLRLFRRDGTLLPVGMDVQPGRAARSRYMVLFGGKPVFNREGKPFMLEYQE